MGLGEGRNTMNWDNAEGAAWCVLAMATGLAGLLRRGAVCSCPVLGSPQPALPVPSAPWAEGRVGLPTQPGGQRPPRAR